MRPTRIALWLLPLFALCSLSAWAQDAPRPAVLLDNWGGAVDYAYMRQLNASGFTVEAISHDQLTWERLQQFNVLVIMDFPQRDQVTINYGGGPASGPNLAETLALLDRFLQAGGGVMINLIQHGNDPTFYNSTQEALARWGARRPLETVTVPDSRLAPHPRLHIPYFFTDQVPASPVSEGVNGVWYPRGGAWTYMTGPIDVDDKWTVALRAPADSRTEPIPLPEKKPGIPYYDAPFQRPGGVASPPLFALRDLQPGRLALFHCSPIFHLASGLSWMHQGALLNTGLQGRPSDFGRLLENSFRWLAQPSLGQGKLGGATVPADRWVPPLQRPDAKDNYDAGWPRGPEILLPDAPPPPTNLLRGLIGPRTAYSGGQGTVPQYAASARKLGLSFLIFLEDFAQLTREELAQLTADCKANSGDDLALYAGYRLKSNLGNTLFFFGADPLYVTDDHLTGPGKKLFKLQGEDKDGKFVAGNSIDFIFQSLRAGDINSVGYYDFTRVANQGAMQLPHLRLFSMCGVMFYDHGKLIEDVTDQYLTTNQGTMTGTPVSINLLDSPRELEAEVAGGRALTYAAAASVKQLWDSALRWNHQYFGCNVFPSTGPRVLSWPGTYRTSAFAGESFVAWRNLLGPRLWVTADAGLQEVALYDGRHLWRRFLPAGAKELSVRLYFSGALQRNLSVVATDTQGGKAVSFPLRGWNDGSPAPVYCGDHVNDGGMALFRGPAWSRTDWVPAVSNAGETWDGGPSATVPLLTLGLWYPSLQTDKGAQDGNHYQVPLLGFADEACAQGRSEYRWIMLPGVPHNNPWSGYGPLQPNPLFDTDTTWTLWQQYYGPDARAWGAHGISLGPVGTLYDQVVTFKQDMLVKGFAQSGLWRSKSPVPVVLLMGQGDQLLFAREVSPFTSPGSVNRVIPTGGWWAGVSPGEANAQLHINYGAPLRLVLSDDGRSSRMEIWAELPPAGLPVKQGEQHRVSIFSMAWPMEVRLGDSEALLAWIRYLQQPTGMELLRGTRREGPVGVLDLQAQDGTVEVKVPQPQGLDPALPCRALGLNPRWSAVLWQYQGYNGANRYGPATNRVRALGMDPAGRVCFPVYAGQAALTHLLVGHPVMADAPGKDLFIETVCLRDAEGDQPPLWHVSVNNPLDRPVTATLRRTMDLPGLSLPDQPVTLQPGEYRVVLHQQG